MSRNHSEQYNDNYHKDDNNLVYTNLIPEAFANTNQLISTDKRWYADDERDVMVDDHIDNYKNNYDDNHHQSYHDDNKHHSDDKHHSTYDDDKKYTYHDDNNKHSNRHDDEENWTEEEMMEKKMEMLRQLGELAKQGIQITQNYSMNSSYKAMKFEHDLHTRIRSKKNAVQWLSGMFIGVVRGFEILNDKYNPFDIKFDDMLSSNVQKDINEYYAIIGEIYEKYGASGKPMDPILKLVLKVSGAAVMIQGKAYLDTKLTKTEEEIDNNPMLINELKNKSNKILEQENKKAQQRIEDFNFAERSKSDFNKMKSMADNTSLVDNLHKNMMFSESHASFPKVDINSFKSELDKKNKILDDINKNLARQTVNKNSRKVTEKDTESSKSKKSAKIEIDSSSSSNSSSISQSEVSNVSSISINPNMRKIIEESKKNKKTKNSKKSADEISFEDISVGTTSKKSGTKKNKK
jgi:hypothetical protein